MSTKLQFSRGEVIADRYEVVDLLDESPLGTTYRTKHIKTSKYVRLSLLRPRIAGRDKKDAIVDCYKKSKAVTHPHLVKIGELGEHDGVAYFTFEDFEGGTLRELLQEYKIGGKQFALKEAAQICMQILEGLGELHKAGMVVRGLRPEQILVSVRYTGPRKTTFVAQTKVMGANFWELVETAELAEDEFTRGEAQYLAPELKSIEPIPSPRSDVYSVAVIFYEMLIGTAPVGTFQDPKTRRPDLPDHVNTVTELALANSPEDRYPSTNDFINDLQRTFADTAYDKDTPRRPLVTPIAWALGLVLVLFIAIILFSLRPDPGLEAEVADSTIRTEVYNEIQASSPSPEDFKKVYERHPQNMIYIPAGPFVHGRLHDDPNGNSREPLAERRTTEGYLVDVFEYPNLRGAAPHLEATWEQAERLCQGVGKRLCTADEWERACKGPRSLIYSYGDYYDVEYCGAGLEDIGPSGAKEKCRSEWGVFDMSGGFREWTGTLPKKGRAVVKGGRKGAPDVGTRCAQSTDENATFAEKTLSFRCCRDLNAPPVPKEPPPPPPEPEAPPAP